MLKQVNYESLRLNSNVCLMLLTTRSTNIIHHFVLFSLVGQLSSSLSPIARGHVNNRDVEKKPYVEKETFVNDGLNSGWLSLPRSTFINRGRFQSERASYLFPRKLNDGQTRLSHRRDEASDNNFTSYSSMKNIRVADDRYNNSDAFKNMYSDPYGRINGFRTDSQPKNIWKFSKAQNNTKDSQSEYLRNLYGNKRMKSRISDAYVYKLASENVDNQKKSPDFTPFQGQRVKISQNYFTEPNARPRHELTASQINSYPFTETELIRKGGLSMNFGSNGRTEIKSNINQRGSFPVQPEKVQNGFFGNQRESEAPLKLVFHKQNYTIERKEIQQQFMSPNMMNPSSSTSSSQNIVESTQNSGLNFCDESSTRRSSNSSYPLGFSRTTPLVTSASSSTNSQTTPTTCSNKMKESSPAVENRFLDEQEKTNVSPPVLAGNEKFIQFTGLNVTRPLPQEKKNMLFEFLATSSPQATRQAPTNEPSQTSSYHYGVDQPGSELELPPMMNTYRREVVWSPAELAYLRKQHPSRLYRIISKPKKKGSEETRPSSNFSSSSPNEYGPCALVNFQLKKDHALYERGRTNFLRRITDDVPAANRRRIRPMVDASDKEDRTFFDRLEQSHEAFQHLLPREEHMEKKGPMYPSIGNGGSNAVEISDFVKQRRHEAKVPEKIDSESLGGGYEKDSEIVKKTPIKFTGEEDGLFDTQSPGIEQEKAKMFHSAVFDRDDKMMPKHHLRERY